MRTSAIFVLATSLLALLLAGCARPTAQLLGTVNDTRGAWNPFLAENDMVWDPAAGEYSKTVRLSASGGRNADGVYALRFAANHTVREAYKADPAAPVGRLATGEAAANADNVLFAVPADGEYTVRFSPRRQSYSITPPVRAITRIESMQINGFVHDAEGGLEQVMNGHTRPAPKWDETLPDHQMRANPDGSWTAVLPLSAHGGHERNGVYQFLFSANANGDWGFCGANGRPGRLFAGCGYNSRSGRVDESAVVIRVPRDADYAITVFPAERRFTVSPEVELLNALPSFQLNGSVQTRPWDIAAAEHQMARRSDGTWEKTVRLAPDGGEGKNGLYVMNFSIGSEWGLDGIAFGGRWGEVWHAVPQESNILFRVKSVGDYTVRLDPAAGTFSVTPPVEPVERITSLKIAGNFSEFADDGQQGWNLSDPAHAMQSADGRVFTRVLTLKAGAGYQYKYAANDAGWSWGLTDYPYDGERRLAMHGNPPPLSFTAAQSGPHRFTADVVTGTYTVSYAGQ
jgi:hypothetical protein